MRRLLLLLLLLLPVAAAAAPWNLNREATRMSFRVGYVGGLWMDVAFTDFAGVIDFDPRRPERSEAEITVQTRAVASGLAPVDDLIRSSGYLASSAFPTLRFDLTGLIPTSKSTADVKGNITLRGVTRPIALKARVLKFDPFAEDFAARVAAFEITGALDRTDFGSTEGLGEVETVLPIRIRLEINPALP